MKTSVETLDETRVKLTVEIDPAAVRKAHDTAAKHLANQVNLPGFRKGKAPRRLLEQRLGKGAITQHALEDHLDNWYRDAVEDADIVPVNNPELDIDTFSEDEGFTFTAEVEVRPEVDLPDHEGLQVTHPEWTVSDDEVDERLAEQREQFAEVEEVERPAATGDYVTIDLRVFINGEELDTAHVEDALYEVGSQGVTAKLDEELEGVEAGAQFTYDDTLPEEYPEHPGEPASLEVTVHDVRAKTLPALDDDFAMTASEFDTLAQLRDDIRSNLERQKVSQARHQARGDLLEAYLAAIDVVLPPSMVTEEVDNQRGQLEGQAEQYGMTFEDLLATQDMDVEQWESQARDQATKSVKARLVLDSLAEELEVEIQPDDVNDEIFRHAMQMGMDAQQVAEIISDQGSLPALVGDIARRKAMDAILDAAVLDGAPDQDTLVRLGLEPDPDADESAGDDEPAADDDADVENAADSDHDGGDDEE